MQCGRDIGFHVFVYGDADNSPRPSRHLARQTLAACQAVARLHRLDPARTFFLQQHPAAIDAGVFHNDVIATSHKNLLLMHEQAFLNAEPELARLASAFEQATGTALQVVMVRQEQLSLEDAVKSYLFNSQLLTPSGDGSAMTMICAAQCERMPQVRDLIDGWIALSSHPISDVRYVSLDQSMSGGAAPRLFAIAIALPASAIDRFAPSYRLTAHRAAQLAELITDFYPSELTWETLASPENILCYEKATMPWDRCSMLQT